MAFVVSDKCMVCGSGPVALLFIDDSQKVIPGCWECESVWEDIDALGGDISRDLRVNYELFSPAQITSVHWATTQEIEKVKLSEKLLKEVELDDPSRFVI